MPSPETSGVRASLLKGWFGHGPELFGAERFEAIRARLPPDVEARVAAAVRTEWLPLELLEAFDGAAWACCGAETLQRAARELGIRLSMSPLLQPFATAAAKLFRLDPARVMTRVPASMATMYRGFGTMSVSTTADGAVVRHEGCPPALATPWIATANCGGLEAILAICRREGGGRVEVDAERAVVVYSFWWR